MTMTEYFQLDEVSKMRLYNRFCERYELDRDEISSKQIFYCTLDDAKSISVTDQNGTRQPVVF